MSSAIKVVESAVFKTHLPLKEATPLPVKWKQLINQKTVGAATSVHHV